MQKQIAEYTKSIDNLARVSSKKSAVTGGDESFPYMYGYILSDFDHVLESLNLTPEQMFILGRLTERNFQDSIK